MKRMYDSKAFWVIVSLLASLAIWIYITSVETEEVKQTFRGVRVELVGEDILRESKNMVITDMDTNTVTVDVIGPRRIISAWDEDMLTARIDVSKLSRAAYTTQTYTLTYPDGTDTSNLRVSSKTPDTVSFMVSPQVSKTIQVRGSFDGSMAEGYTAEAPVFEPSTITITGAESNIKNIEYAWVSFGTDNLSSTYSVETGYTFMDANGQPCSNSGVIASSDVVTATLPLLVLKEVKLDVNIIEGAGASAANTKIRIEPESLVLAGDSSLLAGMNKIVLDTIDLTDFAASFSDVYTIPLDNNINNTSGVNEAKVTVEVTGLSTKNFTVSNISCINVTEGYEVEVLSENLEITLRGKEDVLAEIRSDSIRAVADLMDYDESTGTFMPVVKIYIDGFTEVGALYENTISVEIRKAS